MIKHYLLAAAALLSLGSLSAQNVQLHYDLGRKLNGQDQAERPQLTTTVELFRADKWGNTFFFVDMDYRREGVTSAYWEISREFCLGKLPLNLHLEYNGGLSNSFSYKNAYLVGLTYAYNRRDYSAGFTLTPMYRYLARQDRPDSWQLTGTWYLNLAGGLCTFNGFADLWGDRHFVTGKNTTIFITEPQLWLNLNKLPGVDPAFRLSVGTEVEISSNFAAMDKTIINPTLALKWTF